MKNWMTPAVEELNVANTQYGSPVVTEFDNVYVGADGYPTGTFES